MNKNQKNVLLVTAGIIVAMVIYPPYVILNASDVVLVAGYGFIFDLPVRNLSSGGTIASTINIGTLIAQIISALTVGGLVFFALKND